MRNFHLGDKNLWTVDLEKLVSSRLLIQANSGGGKSHTIRRLLEQTHGQVQQIVLDPEGEFSTLRDQFDYVLAGKGGDVPAEPRSAALLARKLLETGASAIVDLYELHAQERKHFVKLFLDAMVNAPKELWHNVLVVIDEAHVFCPEAGQAESASAVIDLATRGRKRGFCAVLATQRISKLHKDAAAECNNKLIGRTSLDIDMKRAGDELGFGKESARGLRDLDPGCFWAYGPAISKEVVAIMIGQVVTSPAKTGKAAMRLAKPSTAIRSILAKMGDLPKEAETEARTISDLQRENAELRRHRCPETASKEKLQMAEFSAFDRAVKQQSKMWRSTYAARIKAAREEINKQIDQIDRGITEMDVQVVSLESPTKAVVRVVAPPLEMKIRTSTLESPRDLSGGTKRIAEALMAHQNGLTREQLALWSIMSNSGGFRNCLSDLRALGFIQEEGGLILPTEEMKNYLYGIEHHLPTSSWVIDQWRGKFGGGTLRIYHELLNAQERRSSGMLRDLLAECAGMTNSGGFRNCLSELRRAGLLDETQGSLVKITPNLFI